MIGTAVKKLVVRFFMPLLDNAGVQLRLILEIEGRDAPKRLVMTIMVCCLVGAFASWTWAALTAFFILAFEAGLYACLKSLPEKNTPPSRRLTLISIVINSMSSVAYCMPAIILIAQPNSAAQLLGVLWIGGCMTHALAANAIAVAVGWAGLVLQFLCFAVGILLLNTEQHGAMTPLEHAIVAALALVYCWNFIDAMKAQSANRRAFGAARAEAEERLRQLNFLANHDALTGLLNRRAFEEALGDALLMPDPTIPIAVVLFDLDGFKPINDRYGHAAGDAVLRAVGARLNAHPEAACACRLGGDEFVAIIHGYRGETLNFAVKDVARRLAEPIEFDGVQLSVSASGGAALARPGITITELLAQADKEMYRQKQLRSKPRKRA